MLFVKSVGFILSLFWVIQIHFVLKLWKDRYKQGW